MNHDELKSLTGQENYQGGERLVLNEVLLNGDGDIETDEAGQPITTPTGAVKRKGGYFRKRIWIGRTDENAKPEEVNLGPEIRIIMLKIRRKLVERTAKGEILRSTNEHNTVEDTVSVFEGRTKVFTGSAREARETYPGLRTVQYVYALLSQGSGTAEPELVRVTVKGASLGSEVRPENEPAFYRYISSLKEPICTYVTKLGVLLEHGMKTYFSMSFAQAGAVPESLMPLVLEKLQYVHEHTERSDSRTQARRVEGEPVEDIQAEPELGSESADYPDEEINPEDIPF